MKISTIIISIIILILLGVGGVLAWQALQPVVPDDGTTPTINPTPTNDGNGTEPDDTEIPEGWKTYRNEEFGFAFDYPSNLFVGRPTEVKTDYGRQIYISIDRPEMEVGIDIYEGLTLDQLKKRIIGIFENSKSLVTTYGEIEEQQITGSKQEGIMLFVHWERESEKGVHRVFLFSHPSKKDILIEARLEEETASPNLSYDVREKIIQSIRFF